MLESNKENHNHAIVSDRKINVDCVYAGVIRNGGDNLHERPNKIIRMDLQQCSGDIRDDLVHSAVKSFREAMYRSNQKNSVDIQYTWRSIWSAIYKDKQFCFVDDEKTTIIFTCRENLEMLRQSEFVIGGDTFNYASCRLFRQLCTLRVYIH